MSYEKAADQITKNDGERLLNETMFDFLPKRLAQLIAEDGYKGTRYGRYAREHFPHEFNDWFNNVFLKDKS